MLNRNGLSQDQQRFVNDHVKKFRDANTNGTVSAFYDEFYADWFAQFPELNIVFPGVNVRDDLSREDQEELEWHIKNRKAVRFNGRN
jgi:hypothetical protein